MSEQRPQTHQDRRAFWVSAGMVVFAWAFFIWVLVRPDVSPEPVGYRVITLVYAGILLSWMVWGVRRARRDRAERLRELAEERGTSDA